MSELTQQAHEVLYIITCAALPSQRIQDFVTLAQAANWDVCVIATPQAATNFLEVPLLTQLTGHPVRSHYKHPKEPDVLPRANAIVVVPATFNTLNKWALGITDTLALGLLCEYTGLGMPILAVPCMLSTDLARHPAFSRSLAMLKEYGVHILYEPEKYPPKNEVPWHVILSELHQIYNRIS